MVFGSALARSPRRAMIRSQDSKAAAIKETASYAEFITVLGPLTLARSATAVPFALV
jgi:hypothetical protein